MSYRCQYTLACVLLTGRALFLRILILNVKVPSENAYPSPSLSVSKYYSFTIAWPTLDIIILTLSEFIYLAVLDLPCIMQDISLHRMDSLVVALRLSSCSSGLVIPWHVGS